MTRTARVMTTATVLVAVTGAMLTAGQQKADVALRAAIETETVRGDVKGAVEQYRRLAETYAASDRPVAAQALVRMAECYQKLGDAQAPAIYERIVRDYSDQKDAATIARARLGGGLATASSGDRAVWTGPDVDLFGTVSPDGRFLTYVDWNGNQNLMLRDLFANTSRPLTGNRKPGEFGTADFSAISRDGAQVAFWMGAFRVASLKGSGVPTSRVVRTGEYLHPFNWSPDNKSVAVLIDDRQLGIVSVEDGALRQLKWTDWRTVDNVVFSPDGRFIAYDVESADRRGCRDIMVMAVDGNGEVAVAVDASANYLMGWSPDGDIVFTSDRTGTRSLWALRMENGRRQGEPRLVKPDVRATFSQGLTPSGTLYVHQQASPGFVRIAPFDAVQGTVLDSDAGRPSFQQFIEQHGRPRWSADGRHLLFFSCGVRNWPCAMWIRDNNTGDVREVTHDMRYIAFASLAPDGHAVVANGSDVKGRKGIFLIDGTTGTTSLLVSRRALDHGDPEWSRDGRAIRYSEIRDKDVVLLERKVDSEESKEIFRTANEGISRIDVSPDGRLVGFIRRRGTGTQASFTFVVAPLAGGASRDLFTTPEVPDVFFWQWAPDSQSVMLQKHVGEGIELWQLPLAGSPRKLAIDGRQWDAFHVSPDGKQIAFEARTGNWGNEVWALENFLPTPNGKK